MITAGFNKSKTAIALAELLKREGIPVKGFVVVSPYSLSRLRSYIRKRGRSFLLEAIPRLIGYKQEKPEDSIDYFGTFWNEIKIPYRTVKKWTSANQADYVGVSSINDGKAVAYLDSVSPQWLIYSGGGIIREGVINTMKGRILNAHQGPLPEVRGMNAAEWAILLEQRREITIHLIDKGIDTGKIITTLPFTAEAGDTINAIRDKARIKGVEGLVEIASEKNLAKYELKENNADHRLCYILSPAMKELLQKKLKSLQVVV